MIFQEHVRNESVHVRIRIVVHPEQAFFVGDDCRPGAKAFEGEQLAITQKIHGFRARGFEQIGRGRVCGRNAIETLADSIALADAVIKGDIELGRFADFAQRVPMNPQQGRADQAIHLRKLPGIEGEFQRLMPPHVVRQNDEIPWGAGNDEFHAVQLNALSVGINVLKMDASRLHVLIQAEV